MPPYIAALRAQAIKFYQGIDTYNSPTHFSTNATGATVYYSSGTGGLPAGHTDKVFAHDVTVTLGNYTDAIEAGTAASGAATSVVLTGLSPGRLYRLACIRFNDSTGLPVAISNEEIVQTQQDSVEALSPLLSKQLNWSEDQFNDWITGNAHPWDNGQPFFSLHKYNDAEMGDFVQVTYREIQQGESTYLPGEIVPIIFNLSAFEGVKGLSPRHDWRMDIPLRVAAPDLSIQNLWQDGQYGGMYQMETGIAAGDQFEASIGHNAAHDVSVGIAFDSPAGFSNLSPGPAPDGTNFWGTRHPNSTAGVPEAVARTAWSQTNSPTSSLAAGRQMHFNEQNVFSFRYQASTKVLQIYLNDVLHTVLGSTHNLPIYRKKFPEGHLDFAARFHMKFQCLSVYQDHPESQFIDIGGPFVESSCPMHYVGWSARQAGSQGSQFGHFDVYNGVQHYDPTKHTLGNLCVVTNTAYGRARFGSTLHSGYTVPFLPINPYYENMPQILWYDDLLPKSWNNFIAPSYSTALHTGKTLPTDVPNGTRLAYAIFHGYQQYGTLRARIVDQNGTPITDYVTVDTVNAAPILTIPNNTATSVQVEVEIQYDGSTIDYTTQADNGVTPASMEAWRPSSPSLFVGYELYFADPANIPSMVESTYATVIMPGTSTRPVVSLPTTSAARGASVSAPTVSVQPEITLPSASSIRVASVDMPTVTVQPIITLPTATGYEAGTPIRAPNTIYSATGQVMTIYNLQGQPVAFNF